MIVKVTNDKEDIKKVICHPEIYYLASRKTAPEVEEFDPPIGEFIYIGGFDEDIFGLFICEIFREGLKIHPYVLPSKRRKAREFLKKGLAMLNCTTYVEFPEGNKLLKNLAVKNGFDSIANNEPYKTLMMRL